jgi:hypothetical protein
VDARRCLAVYQEKEYRQDCRRKFAILGFILSIKVIRNRTFKPMANNIWQERGNLTLRILIRTTRPRERFKRI